MKVKCINSVGFEDQLTAGMLYTVEGVGENSYIIVNDKHQPAWYGTPQLKVVHKDD